MYEYGYPPVARYGHLILIAAVILVQIRAPNPLTIFQAVDSSFLPLWLNWMAIAVQFGAIPPGTELHLACFGDGDALNRQVMRYHSKGCSQTIPDAIYRKRIYYAKWLAFTKAFSEEKRDMLLIDLDAIMIRSPTSLLQQPGDYDIIASRDHGPYNLPFAKTWFHIFQVLASGSGAGQPCVGEV
jgi:hypothetical protein